MAKSYRKRVQVGKKEVSVGNGTGVGKNGNGGESGKGLEKLVGEKAKKPNAEICRLNIGSVT